MLGNILGALLIVVLILAAIGFLYGMGYLGYWLNGEFGAVYGVGLGCFALYHAGRFINRNLIAPSTAKFLQDLKRLNEERKDLGVAVINKRHQGKASHKFTFVCSNCGKSNPTIAAMDERYTVMCMHCGFRHRLVFKGWL